MNFLLDKMTISGIMSSSRQEHTMAKASAKASTNVFGSAPTIEVSAPSKAKIATKSIKGTERTAALEGVIALLQAMVVVEKNAAKEQMTEIFVTEGMALKRQPENFKSAEGFATASCQLRATGSALSDDAIAMCEKFGIEFVREEKVADTFIFASTYASDTIFVQKLETLLGPKLMELQDERGPIILKQDGVSKAKITDAGRNSIFTKAEAVIRAFLPNAFTLAFGAKLETGGDIRPALKMVEEMIGSPLWKDTAAEAATNPAGLDKKTNAKKKAA
jgi:hypothetical protein